MGEHFDLAPLDGCTFGATVTGIELRAIDDAAFNALYASWLEYGLLVFPEQFLTKDEQNAFARRFGDLEFEAMPITNIRKDGSIESDQTGELVKSIRGNEGWHHDSTYMPIQAKGAVFTAEIVPEGGSATGWADMAAAYDELDDDTTARLAELNAHHSLYYSMERVNLLPKENADGGYDNYGYHDKDVSLRPMIKVHPETGRPNLLIGRHAHNIVGMDPDESTALIDGLNDAACVDPRVHHHQWAVGDAVVWDNRRLMHRATPFDFTQPRRMWHTRIAGEPAPEAALNPR